MDCTYCNWIELCVHSLNFLQFKRFLVRWADHYGLKSLSLALDFIDWVQLLHIERENRVRLDSCTLLSNTKFGSPLLQAFSNARLLVTPPSSPTKPILEAQADENCDPNLTFPRRRLQCVSTKSEGGEVDARNCWGQRWWQEHHLSSCDTISWNFQGKKLHGNIVKCSRWWKDKSNSF